MIIQGKTIILRTVQEKDLEQLYPYHTDLEARGPYFPAYIPSESEFRCIYEKNGFWSEDHGDVLICALQGNLLGVWSILRSEAPDSREEALARIN